MVISFCVFRLSVNVRACVRAARSPARLHAVERGVTRGSVREREQSVLVSSGMTIYCPARTVRPLINSAAMAAGGNQLVPAGHFPVINRNKRTPTRTETTDTGTEFRHSDRRAIFHLSRYEHADPRVPRVESLLELTKAARRRRAAGNRYPRVLLDPRTRRSPRSLFATCSAGVAT